MAMAESGAEAPRWSLAKRIGFRFAFVLFFVHFISPFNQLSGKFWVLSGLSGLLEAVAVWWLNFVSFVGEHVFKATITALPLGSGDTTFNYLEWFCFAAIAAVATLIWSVVAWRRPSHPRLNEFLRTSVRLYVAYFMISYGAIKVVPTQFGTIGPHRLVEQVGDMSPMGILWTFMAASPHYTMFGGAMEMLAGLLLVFRRTALVGALLTAGVMTQVVMLNFCYDVPVKLLSSSLMVMSVFLLLPDAKRLFSFFALGRAAAQAPIRPRFNPRWMNWALAGLTTCLFAYVTAAELTDSYTNGKMFESQTPLAGIWNVVEFQRDGQVVPPLVTDASRWKHIIVDSNIFGTSAVIKTMTGVAEERLLEMQEAARQISLSDGGQNMVTLKFDYEQPSPGVLVLSGDVGGQKLRIKLEQMRHEQFRLLNRGFHWINEFPFNK